MLWFGNWAPADAPLPPPPSISVITWTFTSPLERAEDAVLLDTTDLDLDQSLERLLVLVKERIEP